MGLKAFITSVDYIRVPVAWNTNTGRCVCENRSQHQYPGLGIGSIATRVASWTNPPSDTTLIGFLQILMWSGYVILLIEYLLHRVCKHAR